MSMLEAAAPSGRRAAAAGPPACTGLLSAALLERQLQLDRDVDLYFLGPKPFMQSVYRNGLALGVAQDRLRYEFFGPLEDLRAA